MRRVTYTWVDEEDVDEDEDVDDLLVLPLTNCYTYHNSSNIISIPSIAAFQTN